MVRREQEIQRELWQALVSPVGILLLLTALGNPLANALFGGPLRSLHAMPLEDRVRVMRGMAESAIQLRRAGFQAIKRLVNVSHYAWPATNGSPRTSGMRRTKRASVVNGKVSLRKVTPPLRGPDFLGLPF